MIEYLYELEFGYFYTIGKRTSVAWLIEYYSKTGSQFHSDEFCDEQIIKLCHMY